MLFPHQAPAGTNYSANKAAPQLRRTREPPRPSRFLWLGNVRPTYSVELLHSIFSQFPPDEIQIPVNPKTGLLVGYAFLAYPTVSGAQTALQMFQNRIVTVVDPDGSQHQFKLKMSFSATAPAHHSIAASSVEQTQLPQPIPLGSAQSPTDAGFITPASSLGMFAMPANQGQSPQPYDPQHQSFDLPTKANDFSLAGNPDFFSGPCSLQAYNRPNVSTGHGFSLSEFEPSPH